MRQKNINVSIRLSKQGLAYLQNLSDREHRTISKQIEWLLEEYARRYGELDYLHGEEDDDA